MRIVPALLTQDADELKRMCALCRGFTDYVQVDIMDGEFVSSRSVAIRDIMAVAPGINSEAHLMVKNPLEWLDAFARFGAERIIYHFEAVDDHQSVVSEIRRRGFGAGLAVNPDTKIDDFSPLVEKIDMVLFMSVVPGFYGSTFIPEVLDKISAFKKRFPEMRTGIDGGVKADNVKEIAGLGVDDICIGSALLKAADPQKAYREFTQVINE